MDSDFKHLFLIVSDSLRYDTMRSEMPFLCELAAEGIDIKRCYSAGPGTPSSMPAMMQSRLAIEHGGYGLDLPPKPATLAEQVSDNGIKTLGLHSNTYTTASAGFDRGFDAFADLGGFGDTPELKTIQNINRNPDSDTSGPDWRSTARDVTDKLGVRQIAEGLIKPLKRHGLMEADPRADAVELFDTTLDWLNDQTEKNVHMATVDGHTSTLPTAETLSPRPSHASKNLRPLAGTHVATIRSLRAGSGRLTRPLSW